MTKTYTLILKENHSTNCSSRKVKAVWEKQFGMYRHHKVGIWISKDQVQSVEQDA